MLRTFSILVLLASLLGLVSPLLTPLFNSLPTLAWLLDLASHWQWLYALLLVLSTLLLTTKQKIWLLALSALALPFLTAAPPLPTVQASVKPLKVISSNVYFENSDLSRLKNLATVEQADLVVILEFTAKQAEQVKTWTDYPYQILQPSRDPFGMAILSRFPLSQTEMLTDQAGIQHISTQVEYTQPIKLIGFHPLPPMTADLYRARDAILQQLTKDHQQPTLIAGDFNASPWSSAFSGLSAKGFARSMNLMPTWPSNFKGLMGIPIDQVLASPQWKLLKAKRGDTIGSDHYPIIVELSL